MMLYVNKYLFCWVMCLVLLLRSSYLAHWQINIRVQVTWMWNCIMWHHCCFISFRRKLPWFIRLVLSKVNFVHTLFHLPSYKKRWLPAFQIPQNNWSTPSIRLLCLEIKSVITDSCWILKIAYTNNPFVTFKINKKNLNNSIDHVLVITTTNENQSSNQSIHHGSNTKRSSIE